MYIRLELAIGSKFPEGIYQIIDESIYVYFCEGAAKLPAPDWEAIEETSNGESIIFWFTEDGWRKYGTYFSGIVYEPPAYEWFVEHQGRIHAYIINNEDEYDVAWQDQYQVGLWYEECQDLLGEDPDFIVKDIDSWKQFEESLEII